MGIYVDRKQYDAETKQLALEAIDSLRPTVYLPPEAEAGRRFKNSEWVLALLESATPQSEFLRFPIRAIEAALLKAAQSDWYYNHEKKYDYDDYDVIQDYDEDHANDYD